MTWRWLPAVALSFVLLIFCAPAVASTQVVTFDDLSPGTFVNDQYSSVAGVEFEGTPNSYDSVNGFTPHVDAAPGQAHSSPNVADIATCGCGEFWFEPLTRGYLTTYASAVSVYVGTLPSPYFPAGNQATVELTAYNSSGQPVAPTASTTSTEGQPFTQLSVTSTSGQADIAYFDISSPNALGNSTTENPVAIDDLAITRPSTPPPPDFSLDAQDSSGSIIAGDTTQFPIDIHRANGSSGNIAFTVTGLAAGMTASFSPATVTGTGNSTTLTVTSSTYEAASNNTFTVTATPDSGSGPAAHTLTLQLQVAVNCDHFAGTSYLSVQTDGCMQQTPAGEVAYNEPVRLNGLILTPESVAGPGSNLTIDTANRIIKSVGTYRISLLGAPNIAVYVGTINWNLSGAVQYPKTVVDADESLGNLSFQGLPIGHIQIQLTPTGGAQVTPTLSLGFWPFNYFGGLTSATTFNTDNFHGAQFGGMEFKLAQASVLGLGLKDIDFKYVSSNTWQGSATVVLPFTPPLQVGAGIGITNGQLSYLAGSVNGLNVLIGAGIFLQQVGFQVQTAADPATPPSLTGTMGLSAGPAIEGKSAVTFDGSLKVQLSDPWVINLSGDAKIADKFTLGSAFLQYTSNGVFQFGGKTNWNLGVGSIKGSISGWVQDETAFDVEGSVQGCINLWISDACAGANALVSNIGIAACVNLDIVSGGIGYYWGGSFDLFGGSCDLSPWRPTPPPSSAADIASAARRVTLPAGLPSAVLAVDGVGRAPDVRVTGPGGATMTLNDTATFVRRRNLLGVLTRNGSTYVVIKRPQAGVWTITPVGPVAIKSVREAFGLPQPSVSARVSTRHGKHYLLWHVRPIAGQRVQFSEQGRGVRHLITTTSAGSGLVRFTPAGGPGGRRQIVALVLERGLPRTTIVAGSYRAAAPPRPARASHLQIKRHGTSLVISWKAPPQSFSYAVFVRVADGRHLLLIEAPRARSVTVPGIAAGLGATVTVTGLTADDARGPSASASIKG